VAETIAAELRERILNGTLEGVLPKQDQLMDMFGVSGPSLREALRVLEMEGLVTVRRGKIGGTEVHRPDGASVAHAIGLTLQGERTHLRELGAAVLLFEPTCAAACAGREDRFSEVCPALEENLERTANALGDGAEFTRLSRKFHALVVDGAQNRALRLMVRTMVAVWSIQEETWASEAAEHGEYPELAAQRAALKAHRAITAHIRAGDAERAEQAARRHLRATQEVIVAEFGDRLIDATSPRATEAFRTLSPGTDRGWASRQVI
jgi:DNA-binding FadR family transcriptional regulator